MTVLQPPGSPPPAPVRKPSTLGGLVYLVVVLASAGGLLIVAYGPWRRGIAVIGAALIAAAAARSVLGELNAGMLRVRSRWFDVAALLGVGVLLIVLAVVVPNHPA